MTELEESISRLGEVEHQLRSLNSPFSRLPDRPWEWVNNLADDIQKVRDFLSRVQGRM